MVRHLAEQSVRLSGASPGAPELRGTLYGGFAIRYAARVQAPSQMLVYTWLLPTASIKMPRMR